MLIPGQSMEKLGDFTIKEKKMPIESEDGVRIANAVTFINNQEGKRK